MPNLNEVRKVLFLIIGFFMILFGVITLLHDLYYGEAGITGEKIGILFFAIMLGFSFCYPGLLRDQNNRLSTMRIVVFMMVNVICILFLKEGWTNGISDLQKGLHLNAYWMGIVAFVFGAKATQAFFESKFPGLSGPDASGTTSDAQSKTTSTTEVPEATIKDAIDAQSQTWMSQFNLQAVGIGKKKVAELLQPMNCLVFKPALKKPTDTLPSAQRIPTSITFKSKDGKTYAIPTDVQQTGGTIQTSYLTPTILNTCSTKPVKQPGCSVSRLSSNIAGTIGPKVFKNGKTYILSCYHVLCEPELRQNIKTFAPATAADTSVISPGMLDNGNASNLIGNTIEGQLSTFIDGAIAELNSSDGLNAAICLTDMTPTSVLVITNDHVKAQYEVQLVGRTSGFQTGTITSSYCSTSVQYTINGKPTNFVLNGLISTTRISAEGDSGAAIVDDFGNLIGILVATAPIESYIIPAATLLSVFNLTLTQ